MNNNYGILIVALLLFLSIPITEDNEPPVADQVAELISGGELMKVDLLKYGVDEFNDIGKVELKLIKKDIHLRYSKDRAAKMEIFAAKFDSVWYTKPIAFFLENMQGIFNLFLGSLIFALLSKFGIRYWRGY